MGAMSLRQKKNKNWKVKVVINQIFSPLQQPKNEVKYFENIFSDFESVFSHKRVFNSKLIQINSKVITANDIHVGAESQMSVKRKNSPWTCSIEEKPPKIDLMDKNENFCFKNIYLKTIHRPFITR